MREGICPAPFCKETGEHHTEPILFESEHWRVTLNTFNYKTARVAFLLVHKGHVADIDQMSDSAWLELKHLISRLKREHGIRGLSMVYRIGDTDYTGATVTHQHVNLISGGPHWEVPDGRNDAIENEAVRVTVGYRHVPEQE
nr:Unknown Function [uncultured bacterium]